MRALLILTALLLAVVGTGVAIEASQRPSLTIPLGSTDDLIAYERVFISNGFTGVLESLAENWSRTSAGTMTTKSVRYGSTGNPLWKDWQSFKGRQLSQVVLNFPERIFGQQVVRSFSKPEAGSPLPLIKAMITQPGVIEAGQARMNGVNAIEFRSGWSHSVALERGYFEVWIDAATNLPIRTVDILVGTRIQTTITTDYQWLAPNAVNLSNLSRPIIPLGFVEETFQSGMLAPTY